MRKEEKPFPKEKSVLSPPRRKRKLQRMADKNDEG